MQSDWGKPNFRAFVARHSIIQNDIKRILSVTFFFYISEPNSHVGLPSPQAKNVQIAIA